MKSTPGHCSLSHIGPTVGDILGWDGIKCTRNVDILKGAVMDRYKSLAAGALVMDPIKVFIKREPHKEKKLREGKYRLISAVSLVDTMVDRMLLQNFTHKFIDQHHVLPTAVGWTPLRGGHRLLRAKFPRAAMTADKSSWDWTFQAWLLRVLLEFLIRAGNGGPEWERVLRLRFEALFHQAFFRFADGTIVLQCIPGIMKSGCYMTICLNSMGQFAMHLAAGGKPNAGFWSMGDDTIQDPVEDLEGYLQRLSKAGCVIKECSITQDYDFAGWKFPLHGLPRPMYEDKHKYLMLHADPSNKSFWESYQLMYANDPTMLKDIRQILEHVDARLTKPYSTLVRVWQG